MPVELLLLWLVPLGAAALLWGVHAWLRRGEPGAILPRFGRSKPPESQPRAIASEGEHDASAQAAAPSQGAVLPEDTAATARSAEEPPWSAGGDGVSGTPGEPATDAHEPGLPIEGSDGAGEPPHKAVSPLHLFGDNLHPLPSVAPIAPTPVRFSISSLRLPLTVLLVGGLGLIVLSQILYVRLESGERVQLVPAMVVGLGAFVLGAQVVAAGSPPRWVVGLAWRASRWLGISAGQLGMLLLAPCYALLASRAAGVGVQSLSPGIAWGGWLLAIGLVVAGSLRLGRGRRVRLTWRDIAFTVALLVVALLLRATGTAQIPTTFSGDEGSVGLTAVQYWRDGANNPFTVGWFSFPSLYFWVQSLSIGVFGQTIEAVRIPSALAGSFTVVGVYWLARVLFDRPTAILASGLLLASHYHIHFSRVGLNNVYDGLFAVVALAGVWHGWKTGRRSSFVAAGMALGLGQYFYVAIRILPLLLLIWAGLGLAFQQERFRHRLPDLALTAMVAAVIALPLALYFLRFPTEFSAPLNRVTIFQGWLEKEVVITGLSEGAIIRGQMVKAALGFTHIPLRLLYDAGTPLLRAGSAGMFLIGLFLALWHISLRSALLLLPLASVVVLSGFSQDPPASQRYIVAMPLVAILVALPLSLLYQWLKGLWPEYRRVIAFGVAVIALALMWSDISYYFGDVYRRYTLGGLNTEAATEIALYLERQADPMQDVYFFGAPRMGYYSLSTIPYLNPEKNGVDVNQPLQSRPTWRLEDPTLFVFLPEREPELIWVREAYPGGTYRPFYRGRFPEQLLFSAYEVRP